MLHSDSCQRGRQKFARTFHKSSCKRSVFCISGFGVGFQVVADVWEKDVWDFQAKFGSQVLALISLISWGKSRFKNCRGKCLEVPDILLPDIHGQLSFGGSKKGSHLSIKTTLLQLLVDSSLAEVHKTRYF